MGRLKWSRETKRRSGIRRTLGSLKKECSDALLKGTTGKRCCLYQAACMAMSAFIDTIAEIVMAFNTSQGCTGHEPAAAVPQPPTHAYPLGLLRVSDRCSIPLYKAAAFYPTNPRHYTSNPRLSSAPTSSLRILVYAMRPAISSLSSPCDAHCDNNVTLTFATTAPRCHHDL